MFVLTGSFSQGDTRQPRTMLWSDGMSASQARKALFGNTVGGSSSDSLGKSYHVPDAHNAARSGPRPTLHPTRFASGTWPMNVHVLP